MPHERSPVEGVLRTLGARAFQASAHGARVLHQLGRPLELGPRSYRVRGYAANRLAVDLRHEAFMVPVLRRALADRLGAFLDVGVNTGQTLLKVLAIDPGREYVGFEPQVACCFFVEQFIRDNHLAAARVLPLALSDGNGLVRFAFDDAYDEQGRIADGHEAARPSGGGGESMWVSMRVGDEVVRELGIARVAAIKVDVEGAEGRVLAGLAGTIARERPVVLFEVLPNFAGPERVYIDDAARAENRARADGLERFFGELDYELRQIDASGGERPIERFDLDDRERYISGDFIASPRSRAG